MERDRFDSKTVDAIGKKFQSIGMSKGKDAGHVFREWMDWVLGLFDVDVLMKGTDFVSIVQGAKDENPDFADLLSMWADATGKAMERSGWGDLFGVLYESNFLSNSKASATGQFFTPHNLSDLLAIVAGDSGSSAYDPACGSGRCLLSHYGEMQRKDSRRAVVYVGGDIDPMCVRMTALNMMIHGMVGVAEVRNALSMEFRESFVINEVLCPHNPFTTYSVRHLTDPEQSSRATRFLKQQAEEYNESLARVKTLFDAMKELLGMQDGWNADTATGAEKKEEAIDVKVEKYGQLPLVFD